MLDEQPRKVTRPEPKSIGQSIDAYPIKSSTLDENQSTLDGRLGALPRGAKRGCFWTTSETRTKAGTLGGCRTPIERYIASEWRSCRADRPAVDACSFNPDEHHPIPGGVAAAKGVILSGEFEHGAGIAAPVSQIEVDVMTMSENDRCRTAATQQLLCWRHAISDSLSSRLTKRRGGSGVIAFFKVCGDG
jgi:hypothetical protein